jgi:hypothetical protein
MFVILSEASALLFRSAALADRADAQSKDLLFVASERTAVLLVARLCSGRQ